MRGHLDIWSNGNPPLQKVSFLYESMGSIPKISKIYMCVSLD